MRIAISTSHLYSMGGGFQAVKWHILAAKALGHEVTVFTRNAPSEGILKNWFDGVPLRQYYPHCGTDFDVEFNIDHFAQSTPDAKLSISHTFFPMDSTPAPAEETVIYSNSAYTARHIKAKWNRDAEPLYIPIDNHFHAGDKQKTILHVSRFSEPSPWADKAHRQMIQAFKLIFRKIPGWKLILAGSVDPNQEWYVSELMRLAAGYDIEFMPNISDKTMADLYAQSSIYWHATGVSLPTTPSAQEHMGIAPLEAQASGCVPIVYNSGGMPEVVVNGQTGLLFDNIMDLPKMTLDLIGNMALWAKMSQSGQLWARSWMNFDNFVERVDDMLNKHPLRPMVEWRPALKYKQEDVTIVIPTYNSPLLEKCLISLDKTVPNSRVLVINNGGSPMTFSADVDAIMGGHSWDVYTADSNLGYAGAMKVAEGLVKTPLVLMFNDDVIAQYIGWLENMLLVMNNDSVGVVGAKLLFPDGRLQHAGGALDWNRKDIGYHRLYGQPDSVQASTPQECDFVTGACMLIRRELFNMPEELQEGLYFEELWISNVAREKGFKTVYQPAAVLVHHEGNTRARTQEAQDKIDHNKRAFIERWEK